MTRSFHLASRPLPALIALAFARVTDGLITAVHEAGYDDLERHHLLNVFRFIPPGGIRPAHLATAAGISPQAVSLTLRDLETRGYIVRRPDPEDGRSTIVDWSRKGRAAAEIAEAWMRARERQWEKELGAEAVHAARTLLVRITDTKGQP